MKNTKKTTASKKPTLKPGTVAWLIEELKKCPRNLYVWQGDSDQRFYPLNGVAVQRIDREEGYRVEDDDEEGLKCVTLMSWY